MERRRLLENGPRLLKDRPKILEGGPRLLKHPVGDRVGRYLELLSEGAESTVDDVRSRLYRGDMSILPEQFTILGGRFAQRRERDRAQRRHALVPRLAEFAPRRIKERR